MDKMTDDWKVDGRREWERGRFKVEERSMRWKRAVSNEKKVMKIMDMIEKHFFSSPVVSWIADRFICQRFELCPFRLLSVTTPVKWDLMRFRLCCTKD